MEHRSHFCERRTQPLWWFGLGVSLACGSQAGKSYQGEPLLNLRGHAVVTAATGGVPIVPALCFVQDGVAGTEPSTALTLADLPEEVARDFASSLGGELRPGQGDYVAHILEVENNGQFPAQFDIDVYAPPARAALAPLADGEPRMATGFICAARERHRTTTSWVQLFDVKDCTHADADPASEPTACRARRLWIARGSRRYYSERYECAPPFEDDDCTVISRSGDATLKHEQFAEDVVGAADLPVIVYLDAPARPGSRTAWVWGAGPRGLSAGYHVFRDWPLPPPDCAPSAQEIGAQLAPPWNTDPALHSATDEQLELLTPEQRRAHADAALLASIAKCPTWSTPPSDERTVSIEITPEPPPLFGSEE